MSEGVEPFGGNLTAYADRPGDFQRLLHETELRLVAVYSGANFIFPDVLEEELWRIERAASLASQFGAEHLVVGGGAQRARGTTAEDFERLAGALDEVVALAGRHDLQASYHPHLTTMVEGPEQLERIMARSRINFCPDTAHLVAGGGDPAELIRRHADRIVYVHLKDFVAEPFAIVCSVAERKQSGAKCSGAGNSESRASSDCHCHAHCAPGSPAVATANPA